LISRLSIDPVATAYEVPPSAMNSARYATISPWFELRNQRMHTLLGLT